MRILHVISQTRIGGAENFAAQLVRALGERGHAVRLAATRDNGDLFRTVARDLPVSACRRKARLDPEVLRFLAREIRTFRPDVLHSHNFGPNSWSRALAMAHPRLKLVCHFHSGRIRSQSRRSVWIERALNRRASILIAVSEEIARILVADHLIAPRRVRVVPVGIDMEPLRRAAADESILPAGARHRVRLLHIASMTPVKNHRLLLESFAALSGCPDAALLLAGDGPLRDDVERQVDALGLRDRVAILGERRDIPELLTLSRCTVLPSLAEGLPLAILESMAAGVPVIASRVGGIPNLVDDGRTGMLVPPGDGAELTAAMQRALADPEGIRTMGEQARDFVERKYSIRVIAEEIEKVYRELLRSPEPDAHE